jgi:hypothetical protein
VALIVEMGRSVLRLRPYNGAFRNGPLKTVHWIA